MRGFNTRLKRLSKRISSPHKTYLLVVMGNGDQTPFDMTQELPQDVKLVVPINGATPLSHLAADLWEAL